LFKRGNFEIFDIEDALSSALNDIECVALSSLFSRINILNDI